jgi:hypothetical protein
MRIQEAPTSWSSTQSAVSGVEILRHVMRRCSCNLLHQQMPATLIAAELYRRSASNGVLMKCILRSEGLELLQEIHGGECGNHAASANLVGKAYRSGFYWPTTLANAQDLVRRCKGCQFFAKQQHIPAQVLRTIPPSWPFAIWALTQWNPSRWPLAAISTSWWW